MVGNPHRAQSSQFELFELILFLKLDQQFPVEQFAATASQSTEAPPPRKHGDLNRSTTVGLSSPEMASAPLMANPRSKTPLDRDPAVTGTSRLVAAPEKYHTTQTIQQINTPS